MGARQLTRAAVVALLATVAQSQDAPVASLRGKEASGFLSSKPVGEVTIGDVQRSLLDELKGKTSQSRLHALEAALKPMYEALPKEASGYLSHQAVRYALHRLLLQRHGWFIVGLEPTNEALPPYLHKEWVPQFLQGMLEARLGDRGLSLGETAALAAVLEDLVHAEADRRLESVFDVLKLPSSTRLTSVEADRVLESYMMMYLDGGNFTQSASIDKELAAFKEAYDDWEAAAAWMRHIKEEHVGGAADNRVGRGELKSIANELGERFSEFNDGECRSLKGQLMSMEGALPGRVPIMDFYKKGLYSHWEFNERPDYLRALGALDETDPAHPSVITANYLGSRPNCLAASNLYAVCCRNECEDLMGSLEKKFTAPHARPDEILTFISGLASDTVNASRTLSETLKQRLQGIAERHGGKVPIHGRLFAQWMHHAYPRECPYPHESGTNPLTPNEWMQEAGEPAPQVKATEDEVREILGDCAGADGTPCRKPVEQPSELPWSEGEALWAEGALEVTDEGQEESPSTAVVLGKLSLLATILVFMSFANGHLGESKKPRAARYLDFADFEEEDPKKAMRTLSQHQQWGVVFAIATICIALETMGWLDRFSFCCTLMAGLLLNVVLRLIFLGPSEAKKRAHKHLS